MALSETIRAKKRRGESSTRNKKKDCEMGQFAGKNLRKTLFEDYLAQLLAEGDLIAFAE